MSTQRDTQLDAQALQEKGARSVSAVTPGAMATVPDEATEHRYMVRQLADSEERFGTVFDETPVSMAIVDGDLGFVRVNEALCAMLGYTEDELLHRTMADVTPPEDVRRERELTRRMLAGETTGYELEKWYLTKRGTAICGHLTAAVLTSPEGHASRFVAIVEDIGKEKEAQTLLTHLALHDGLTGLANRALAIDRLRLAQTRADRSESFLALLSLDLDGFERINESFGHGTADALLVETARRLESALRPVDSVARVGGDEFLVCCENLGSDDDAAQAAVVAIAERISTAISCPLKTEAGVTRVTASIGIALVKGSRQPAEVVLRHADAAMYRAKQRGRARYELFDEPMRAQAVERMEAVAELRAALERDELVVHYQPIVDLRDGRITGAEALVRWEHPTGGLLLPGAFLPLAEDSGLIVAIGNWVLRQACTDLASWRRTLHQDLVVAVNASGRQLGGDALAPYVTEILAETGLDPGALNIELTEGVLIDASGATLAELQELRALGVHLSLDDFGTGYASLTYLQRLPVDFVKVDRSFVGGLGVSSDDAAIVDAVVRLARSLGLQVIAEGIETAEQHDALRTMDCRFGQGWHLGHPQPAAAFLETLTARQSG